jgi:L-aminoadipate-semialdehyde dehydrogenase
VEYVSSIVVAALKEHRFQVFHTVNPDNFSFDDLFQISFSFGFPLSPVDYIAWRDALQTHTLSSSSTASEELFPLLHFVLDDLPTKSRSPKLDNANALALSSAVHCLPMRHMLPKILSFLVSSFFFFFFFFFFLIEKTL